MERCDGAFPAQGAVAVPGRKTHAGKRSDEAMLEHSPYATGRTPVPSWITLLACPAEKNTQNMWTRDELHRRVPLDNAAGLSF